jgi:hypothetical protein
MERIIAYPLAHCNTFAYIHILDQPEEKTMNFSEYYRSLTTERRFNLAERAGMNKRHIDNIAFRSDRAGPGAKVCARLMAADRRITMRMLRPDLFDL